MTLVNTRAAFEKAVTDKVSDVDPTVTMVYDNVHFTINNFKTGIHMQLNTKFNKLISALAPTAAVVAALASGSAQATCSPEPYIGSVCTTAATFCPRGYFEASGQVLIRITY